MAKVKQPSAKTDDMIEVDVLENTAQAQEARPSGAVPKTFRPVLLIALASFFLSFIALVFAIFALWQGNQIAALEGSKLNTFEKRFAASKEEIGAGIISQQKAIVALGKRFDQLSNAALSNNPVDTGKDLENDTANKNDTKHVAEKIDERLVSLERTVQELVASTPAQPSAAVFNDPVRDKLGRQDSSYLTAKPDQASLLIASGLLADNMVGAPLDRWIDLLQGQVDRGVVIPNLAQLRILANPTPKRPFSLIRDAHDLIPEMAKALYQANHGAGFMEQVGAKLGQLVRLREIGDGADGNEVALQEFEAALAAQDLDGAISAASQWSGPDVSSLDSWMVLAQSRRSLDRAVKVLVKQLLAATFAVQR